MSPRRQAKIRAASGRLAGFGLEAIGLGLLVSGCPSSSEPPPYEPARPEPHVVHVAADAFGEARRPAHVALFLQRGALRVTGGGTHLVEGTATGAAGDPPPRVDVGADRISVVQAAVGGAPPKGDASFELSLGRTPVVLSIETGAGEPQTVDLGGVSLAAARVHTTTGHLALDWTRANALPGGKLELVTESGDLAVNHLGRFAGGAVEVRVGGGLVRLDLGDPLERDVTINVEVVTGKLVVQVPKNVAADAEVSPASSDVKVEGWRPRGMGFTLGDASTAPRVLLRVRCEGGHVELVAL